MHRLLAAAVCMVGLGCSTSEYQVVVRFDDESLVGEVQRIELTLAEGECRAQPLPIGGPAVNAIQTVSVTPGLRAGLADAAPGSYALYARGFSSICDVVAAGCTEVVLKAGGEERLIVLARRVAGAGCLPGERCVAAQCVGPEPDGGLDAGGRDGGGDDAGPSADAGCFDVPTCRGDEVYVCAEDRVVETCAAGCTSDPTARCRVMIPSNVQDRIPLDASSDTRTFPPGSFDIFFDTGTGQIARRDGAGRLRNEIRAPGMGVDPASGIAFQMLPPIAAGGLSLGVFSFGSLTLEVDAIATAVGPNALVLLVRDDAVIEGTLTARSQTDQVVGAGAGAGAPRTENNSSDGANGMGTGAGSGGMSGGGDDFGGGGGGGGGFGSAGGTGASGSAGTALGGSGGMAYGQPSLEPLLAGSGGGCGGSRTEGPAGDGGGALQISAGGSIRVGATAVIDAGGGGGTGGRENDNGGGCGGGSGGAILLEAPALMIAGTVGAPGGGGGEGGGSGSFGRQGDDGFATAIPARGGATGGSGGPGGDGSDASGSAGGGTPHRFGGGAGGGGAGRVRFNTLTGSEPFTASSGIFTVGTVTIR